MEDPVCKALIWGVIAVIAATGFLIAMWVVVVGIAVGIAVTK